jgi:hypothetical protein
MQSMEEEYKTSAKVTAARPQCGVRRVRVFQRNLITNTTLMPPLNYHRTMHNRRPMFQEVDL